MKGDVIGFGAPVEISRANFMEVINFARCSGDSLCVGGFEYAPCVKCGLPTVVGMSFISPTNDLYYTSCCVCGAVYVEAPIYATEDNQRDTGN